MMQRGCDKVRPWRICVTGSTPNTPNLRPGFRSLPWLPCQKNRMSPSDAVFLLDQFRGVAKYTECKSTDGWDRYRPTQRIPRCEVTHCTNHYSTGEVNNDTKGSCCAGLPHTININKLSSSCRAEFESIS